MTLIKPGTLFPAFSGLFGHCGKVLLLKRKTTLLPDGNNWNSRVGNVEIRTFVCERFEIFVSTVTIETVFDVHNKINEISV